MNGIVDALEQPKALAVTFGGELTELADEAISNIAQYADVAELRGDKFADPTAEYLKKQMQRLGAMPVLFTLRMAEEGGGWPGPEEGRLPLYEALAVDVDGADIENGAAIRDDVITLYSELDKPVIVSHHDLAGTPERIALEDMLLGIWESIGNYAGYAKIATTINSMEDFSTLVNLTAAHEGEPIIVVGMDALGPQHGLGAEFRKKAFLLGSRLSYAHDGQGAVAPGQLHYLEMARILGKL